MPQMEQQDMVKDCCNCQELIAESASFCPHCGQKCTTGRVTLKQLFQEFLESILNIDSRFFKTVSNLFVPGKLTTEYFKGKHKTYIQPVRIFFVLTVVFIASINFLLDEDDININNMADRAQKDVHNFYYFQHLDTTSTNIAADFNNRQVSAAFDSLRSKMPGRDSSALNQAMNINMQIFGNEKDYPITEQDIVELTPDEIIEKYDVEGFWNKMIWKQQIRMMDKGGNFVMYIINNATWMILLLLPFFALFMKLLYIRRDYYYVEHLVFSFHVHAFMFLLLTLQILLAKVLPEWTIAITFGLIVIYIVFAMRRFYHQQWWKTLFKFFIANTVYTILLSVTAAITIAISFFLF